MAVTPSTTPAVARLRPDAAQQAFRALLDAFARPGTVVDLGPIAAEIGVAPTLVPALALADLEVVTAVLDDPDAARLLERSTGTRLTDELDDADMVLATGLPSAADVARLRRGDAFAPELGARLVIGVDGIAPPDADGPIGGAGSAPLLRLTGPGAQRGRTVRVADLTRDVVDALANANADHPAGIDTWLVDPFGACVGIPRSSRVELLTTPPPATDDSTEGAH